MNCSIADYRGKWEGEGMPVAHLASVHSVMDGYLQNMDALQSAQQSQLASQYMNSIQSMQAAQLQMNWQQAEGYSALAQFDIAANANALPKLTPSPYFMARAKSYAKRGEKLIDRMAFWGALPFIGDAIAGKLADRLERVTDEVESFARLAA